MGGPEQYYDPQAFDRTAVALMSMLGSYLRSSQAEPYQGLPWVQPSELKRRALEMMDVASPPDGADAVAARVAELAKLYLQTNNRLHSPHYMGHQVPPPIPIAGLFEVLGSTANQPSGVYEMGPLPSAVERAMAERLGSYLGWNGLDFDAIATHGGSAANLTAILAARNVRYGSSWQKGVAQAGGGRLPAVICSAESHYSVTRAAGIVGLGVEQVIKAPIDPERRLDDRQLDELIERAGKEGREVFCVVASACTTPTGAFDRLEPVAEVCRKRGLWLHVDAAHGGGLLLSRKHRHLLNGVDRADSVTWDAHKMMFVPALCTFLFYRDKKHSYQAFDQDAPYLFDRSSNPTLEYDGAIRTLECTKRPVVMALWAIWCVYGPSVFEALVDRTMDLAREFHGLLSDASDFEPLHEPQCNILCFRHVPQRMLGAPVERISELQGAIRRKLIESGDFYITATRLDGAMALRVTLTNPLTETRHLEALMEAIRRCGA